MTDIDAFSALLQRNVSNVWPDEVMARHTGFRIGGQAKLYVECDTMDGFWMARNGGVDKHLDDHSGA